MNRKQILFIFAIVVLVCLTRGISVGGNVDVNGDGVVNTADLEFVDQHIGTTGEHPADVNDDNGYLYYELPNRELTRENPYHIPKEKETSKLMRCKD